MLTLGYWTIPSSWAKELGLEPSSSVPKGGIKAGNASLLASVLDTAVVCTPASTISAVCVPKFVIVAIVCTPASTVTAVLYWKI